MRRATDDYSSAAQTQAQEQAIYGDLGNRLGQANALVYLGAVRQMTRDSRPQARCWIRPCAYTVTLATAPERLQRLAKEGLCIGGQR